MATAPPIRNSRFPQSLRCVRTALARTAGLVAIGLTSLSCTSLPDESRILQAGGRSAQTIVQKARNILAHQQVFAATHVGYGGQPTSGCWALTVLVRHDPQARSTFTDICHLSEHPAARLYAVAGLLALDPEFNPTPSSLRLAARSDPRVECLSGCDGESLPISRALARLRQSGPSPYLYQTLPSLYKTIDCQPLPH